MSTMKFCFHLNEERFTFVIRATKRFKKYTRCGSFNNDGWLFNRWKKRGHDDGSASKTQCKFIFPVILYIFVIKYYLCNRRPPAYCLPVMCMYTKRQVLRRFKKKMKKRQTIIQLLARVCLKVQWHENIREGKTCESQLTEERGRNRTLHSFSP